MPLQLTSIFSFIFLVFPPAFSTGLLAKHGCSDWCGNLSIPYPFGVGSGCSMEPSFDITCRTSGHEPPKAYLSAINKEVVEINETYIRVRYPNLVSVCYDSSDTKDGNMSVNLLGTPYTLSGWNWLTVIGCNNVVLQYSEENSVIGGCSAFCAEKNGLDGVGYCSVDGMSLNGGCCQGDIYTGTDFLRARLTFSRGTRRSPFPCGHAFIMEKDYDVYSYPLYYLDNSTLLKDTWSSTEFPVVRLDWKIKGSENCNQAKQNRNTYACRDIKSVCSDDTDLTRIGFQNIVRGYLCSCATGYEGNPYLDGGCKAISFSSSIVNDGCPDQCGMLSIPYPFGVGPDCSLAPSFDITCNTSTNPPKAYLTTLNKEISSLTSSHVSVIYPNLGFSCYNSSDNKREITTIEARSLIIDLSGTQYTLSEENVITAIGGDDMVVGFVRKANRSFIGSSCATILHDREIYSPDWGYCSLGSSGDGCCRTSIPRGTTYLEVHLSVLSGRWPRTNFSCSYAFVDYGELRYESSYLILNNSTGITLDYPFINNYYYVRQKTLVMNWRIGAMNCNEAQRNHTTFACGANSDCIDFDATLGGYLCNCSKGYQGNPYLAHGCQDINECADYENNPCHSMANCSNTHGSFYCTCPKGYAGNGMKDGSGCVKMAKSKTKIKILTDFRANLMH